MPRLFLFDLLPWVLFILKASTKRTSPIRYKRDLESDHFETLFFNREQMTCDDAMEVSVLTILFWAFDRACGITSRS